MLNDEMRMDLEEGVGVRGPPIVKARPVVTELDALRGAAEWIETKGE